VAGAVAGRPKVASGLAVVIAEGPAMRIARPKSAGFILRRVSTVSISRPPCGLGAFGLVGGRRLALHLFLVHSAKTSRRTGAPPVPRRKFAIIPFSAFVFAWHQAQRFIRPP
jgi:hypothetical protein